MTQENADAANQAPLDRTSSTERTLCRHRDKPSIVFCHGLWADGSCFSKLIPALRADGHEVIAAEYGLDSAQGDVDCTLRALGRVSSPAILVGHSYGGSVITAAGTDDRVAGLVYIAALGPRRGRDFAGPAGQVPRHGRLRAHRGRRRSRLAASVGNRLLLRGFDRGREGDRVGDRDVADRGSVQPEGRRRRLENEAERVRRGQQRPHRQPGAGAFRGQPDGCDHLRAWTAVTCRCSRTPSSCSTSSEPLPAQFKAPPPARRCSPWRQRLCAPAVVLLGAAGAHTAVEWTPRRTRSRCRRPHPRDRHLGEFCGRRAFGPQRLGSTAEEGRGTSSSPRFRNPCRGVAFRAGGGSSASHPALRQWSAAPARGLPGGAAHPTQRTTGLIDARGRSVPPRRSTRARSSRRSRRRSATVPRRVERQPPGRVPVRRNSRVSPARAPAHRARASAHARTAQARRPAAPSR